MHGADIAKEQFFVPILSSAGRNFRKDRLPRPIAKYPKLEGLDNYTLPAATDEALGGVKIGAGLAITEGGILSATGGGIADLFKGSAEDVDTGRVGIITDDSFGVFVLKFSFNDDRLVAGVFCDFKGSLFFVGKSSNPRTGR